MDPFARPEGCDSEHRELACRYWMPERPTATDHPFTRWTPRDLYDLARFLLARTYRPR